MIKTAINIDKIKPYRAGMSIEDVKRKYNLVNLIKLASNENSFGPSPKVIEKLKKYSENAHIYPDGNCVSLKEKLSETLNIDTDNIIIGNGSNEIIELTYRTFLYKNEKVVSCFPTFSFYKISASTTNGKYTEIPLQNYKFNLDGIIECIDNMTKIVIICNPNNPTGTMVTKEEVENFIKAVPENVLIVIDEAYIEFANKDKAFKSVEFIKKYPNKNILILRTFSKLYGLASLRIGYGISNKKIISYLNRVRQPFNVNGFAQIAAFEALSDSYYADYILNEVKKGKIYLYKELKRLNIDYLESNANFIFFQTSQDNDIIFEEFLKRGVIIRSLKSFGYSKALRVTVGKMEENIKFIETLEKIINEKFKNG
jgi:histidinol-phosphate aminotransferase